MATEASLRALGVRAAQRALRGSLPSDLVAELVSNRVAAEPQLAELYESMTDEQARLHFGAEEPLGGRASAAAASATSTPGARRPCVNASASGWRMRASSTSATPTA